MRGLVGVGSLLELVGEWVGVVVVGVLLEVAVVEVVVVAVEAVGEGEGEGEEEGVVGEGVEDVEGILERSAREGLLSSIFQRF